MNVNTKNDAHAAAIGATIAPYLALAASIATALEAVKELGKEAKSEREGVWLTFKRAIPAAVEAGHDAATMRKGLSLACATEQVAEGTLNRYLPLVCRMREEVGAETLTLHAAVAMSVKDAGNRYRTDEEKRLAAARKAFAELSKDWDAARFEALVAGLSKQVIEGKPAQEASTADKVQEQRAVANA